MEYPWDLICERRANNERSRSPVIVNTWGVKEFVGAGRSGLLAMKYGLHRLDVVEGMCRYCQTHQCDGSVGYGSHPDSTGRVTLDALIMDGPGVLVGSVGGLDGVRDAVGVARAVMDHTQHTLLIGEGARHFAQQMGFSDEGTETVTSNTEYKEWLNTKCQPNFYKNMRYGEEKKSCGPYIPNRVPDSATAGVKREWDVEKYGHDTIAAIHMDRDGHFSCATTTNGAAHKVAGRVGDSPILGSGCYVEEGAGGAGATGDGDVMMRFLPSFQAVHAMKYGETPGNACKDALLTIAAVYPFFQGGLICVNIDGKVGAASYNMGFQYTTATIEDDDVKSLFLWLYRKKNFIMSICRQNFASASENHINDQINVELTAAYHYLSAAAYFNRDDVALPGFRHFFKKSSEEEHEHAQSFIDYQNKRGGVVTFQAIEAPPAWNGPLMAMEAALAMELRVNASLLNLHKTAEENNDAQMTDFIDDFLLEQVNAQKELADLITNLKRVGGDSLGLYLFDQQLHKKD
eukprot:CFRG4547T1